MATTTIYNNALQMMVEGTPLVGSNLYKVMLLDSATSTYAVSKAHVSVADVLGANGGVEVAAGSGYTAGGATIATASVNTSLLASNVIGVDFSDVSWTTSTISAKAAVVYRPGATNADKKLVAYIDFGATVSSSASTLTVDFTTPLRFAN